MASRECLESVDHDPIQIDHVEVHQFLSQSDCHRIVDSISSSSASSFIQRRPGLQTLGAASYLDIRNESSAKYYNTCAGSLNSYLGIAKKCNPSLLSMFSGLYKYIEQFFSARFNLECRIHGTAAVPGFHVYENHADFGRQNTHIPHFDGQYQGILPLFPSYMRPSNVIGKTLSFTLPVSLPSSQGGMRVWDYHYREIAEGGKNQAKKKLALIKPQHIQYKVGSMVFHSGHLLHQIHAWSASQGEEKRITLQGHGILLEQTLYLYW